MKADDYFVITDILVFYVTGSNSNWVHLYKLLGYPDDNVWWKYK